MSVAQEQIPRKEFTRTACQRWGIVDIGPQYVLAFLRYYMPDYFYKPWSEFHRECAEIFVQVARANSSERHCIVAPRSVAKSTMFSVGLPVFAALHPAFCQKHFIVIISDTFGQAVSKIEAVKNILETNELIRADFGDVTTDYWSTERILAKGSPMVGFGGLPKDELDEEEEEEKVEKTPPPRFVIGNKWEGTLIIALGTQMKIRGRTFRQWRPDCICLDDPQNDKQVMSPTQREQDMDWLYSAVLPAGSVEGCSTLALGTALHEECMVETIRAEDLTFETRLYKMVMSWPEREDLWARCRMIFTNLELGKMRKAKTEEYYLKHKAEMDKGFVLLQNWASDVREEFANLDVMILLWTKGAAFWRERQNEPAKAGDRLFNWDRFSKFSKHLEKGKQVFKGEDGKKWSLADYTRIVVGIDPAEATPPAKQKKGELDFCAVVTMGLHVDGYRDVLEMRVKKQGAEAEIDNVLDFCAKWVARDIYIEANMYQGLASLIRKRAKERHMQVRVHAVKATEKKEVRIATLEPDINSGWIRFTDDLPQEARQQFNKFRAGAKNDDAPDVTELTDRMMTKGQVLYKGDMAEAMGRRPRTGKDEATAKPVMTDTAMVPGTRISPGDTMAPACEGVAAYDGRNLNQERNKRILNYCGRFVNCEGCPIAKDLKWETPVSKQFTAIKP